MISEARMPLETLKQRNTLAGEIIRNLIESHISQNMTFSRIDNESRTFCDF
jgi:hypothetical protein